MKLRVDATAVLLASCVLHPLCAQQEQLKPENFNNFPIPTKGTEKDPKLVYELQQPSGSKTTITTSERETSMVVVAGAAVAVTLIAAVSACILSGQLDITKTVAAWRGNDQR